MVRFDFNGAMKSAIGDQGIDDDELKTMGGPLREVHRLIQERSGAGRQYLGFLDLPFQDDSLIDAIQEEADRLAEAADSHVILGIGGSYLGAKAIFDALCHPFHNLLQPDQRKGRPRLFFEGNAMDPDALSGLKDVLGPFTLNVVSKSGTTLETAIAYRILKSWKPVRSVATTDPESGALRRMAEEWGMTAFGVPGNVGGRYSVLSPVGLLPAAVMGVDIRALLAGARDMAERCQSPDWRDNPAYAYAAIQQLAQRRRWHISVLVCWSKALETFGFWHDQLVAESLGKQGRGRMPLTAVSSRDLHSRGQQWQEGARNMLITNLYVEGFCRDLTVPDDPENRDGLNYVAGTPLSKLQETARLGTNFAYQQAQRPTVGLSVPVLNAHALGQLFYLFELSTVAEGYLMGINPLDQPGVEAYKRFMFALLGREDLEDARRQFGARPAESDRYRV